MATAYYEKKEYKAVGMSPDGWSKTTNEDGSRTYTSTVDTATAEVKFADGTTQPHDPMKTGSTIKINSDGSVEIVEIT